MNTENNAPQENTTEPPPGTKPKRAPYFEVAADDQDNYHWILWAPNGYALAMSAEPYSRQIECVNAIKNITHQMPHASKIVIARRE